MSDDNGGGNVVKPDFGKRGKGGKGGKGGAKRKGGAKKGGSKKKDDKPKESQADLKAKELTERAKSGDPEALSALSKIVVSFERWKKALADQRQANSDAKELEGGADAAFENAVEQGLPVNADANAVFKKLQAVEMAWQEKKEAYEEAAQIKSAAADKVKRAAGILERATQDGAQLTIPGTGE